MASDEPTEGEEIADANAAPQLHRLDRSWQGLRDVLAAVPAERLAEPGVCGDWSVADLMGHVAFWDRRAIARGEAALGGGAIEPEDIDVVNARERAARVGRTGAEQRQEMDAAHADLLEFVALLAIQPDRRDAALTAMAVDTDDHYDDHAAQVRVWLAASDASSLAATEAAFDDLLAATSGLPPERLAEPGVCGEWSAAALVGHVGFWVDHTAVEVGCFRPGQPAAEIDWQARNEADAAAHEHAGVDQQFARFHAARDRLRSAVAAFRGSPEARATLHAFVLADTAPHAAEHAAQIRSWRDRHGG